MNSLQALSVLIVLAVAVLTNVAGSPYPGPSDCGRSEVFSRCEANSMCQKTCDNYDKPIACTRSGIVGNICIAGCVCKEGFVRVAQGDQCIPISKCEGRVKH